MDLGWKWYDVFDCSNGLMYKPIKFLSKFRMALWISKNTSQRGGLEGESLFRMC